MADKVAVVESEYDALKKGLISVHQDCISQITTVGTKITQILEKDGGFYAYELSSRIKSLVEEIEAVKSSMETVFDASETMIESFKTVVADYDTLG
jgi:seryl-tRNA synthetase